MAAADSLQNDENPNGSHFSDYTMVYFDLVVTRSEVCQIGAHFGESSLSRYICPSREFRHRVVRQTKLSMKGGILYLEGKRVETVSRMVAWKDFLKFLRSAKNSVVLVMHDSQYQNNFLFRDLTELSLMDGFREVCAGVVDTLPLCRCVFPGRKEIQKNYKLKELVKDELGEESLSHNAIVEAINLEKLMNHADVKPEIFQQHFVTLSNLECQMNRERSLENKAKRAAEDRTSNDSERCSTENGENSSEPLLSGTGKAGKSEAKRRKTSTLTVDVSKGAEKTTAKDSLQNNENPNGSHNFSDLTMVYIDLKTTGNRRHAEIYQIGAHFADSSFSRYMCPNGTFAPYKTELSKKDGIIYIRGEPVETVSKTDAWKDFLKFLQSANSSVVLVTHHKLDSCYLLFQDLSELSLMQEFREVCVGVVDTLPLCTCVFPERKELGKNYKLKDLVTDELGEENLSFDATVIAINVEMLMKRANVQPEMFQQHFFYLSDLEYRYQRNRERSLEKKTKRADKAVLTFGESKRTSMESGEDRDTSLPPDRTKARKPRTRRKKTSAITPDVSKQEIRIYLENQQP